MAEFLECEKHVVKKLISALSTTLNCYSKGNNTESEVLLVEKVLQILLSQNESLYDNEEGNDGTRGVMRSISENQEFIRSGENSTNVILAYGDDERTTISGGVDTAGGKSESTGTNKLHQLEIIKVFVLIFVISIILLTTCRMVFQLFIRFRPEKPPLA